MSQQKIRRQGTKGGDIGARNKAKRLKKPKILVTDSEKEKGKQGRKEGNQERGPKQKAKVRGSKYEDSAR